MYLCDYYNKCLLKVFDRKCIKKTYLLNKIHFLKEKTYKKKLNTFFEKKEFLLTLISHHK